MTWEIFIYLTKVNLAVLIGYGIYMIFIAQGVAHQWKRWFLVLLPLMGVFLPLLAIKENSAANYYGFLPEVNLSSEITTLSTWSVSWVWLILTIWCIGVVVTLIRSFSQLKRVVQLNDSYDGECSFTFFKSIRINNELPEDIKRKVYLHEKVHADQWHTLDLVWYELFRIVFWFNPVYNLIQQSLKEVHEYIADAETNKKTENYSETLVAFAFGLNELPLTSQFQSVNIKNRIKMIHKNNSPKHKAGLVLSLSLALVAVVSISWTTISNTAQNDQKVYKVVDTMPVFNGCEAQLEKEKIAACSLEKLMKYVISNVEYPVAAREADIEGKVFVEFIVDVKGKVKDATIKRSANKYLDAEALRVVNAMPIWTAGIHEGKEVNVSMVLPINFALD